MNTADLPSVLRQLPELVLQLAADQRIERAERLVHQNDLRVGGERAGQSDALLHAARELVADSARPSRRGRPSSSAASAVS